MKLTIGLFVLALGAMTFALPEMQTAFGATNSHHSSATISSPAQNNLPDSNAGRNPWATNSSPQEVQAVRHERRVTMNTGSRPAQAERQGWPNNNESGLQALSGRNTRLQPRATVNPNLRGSTAR
jgi:hypothetical protein